MEELKITGIYDNTSRQEGLISGWGFAVLVSRPGFHLLFDTGADVNVLRNNMETLEISPAKLDGVMLSHPHCDHVGGISGILRDNTDLTVYMTEGFPEDLKNKVKDYGAELVVIGEKKVLSPGLISTGELTGGYRGKEIPEQSLIAGTDRGPVVISGCAHPGITKIVGNAKRIKGESPHLILGGFHLGSSSREEINGVLEEFEQFGVERIAPTHCTGNKAINIIEREYGNGFLQFGAGEEVVL